MAYREGWLTVLDVVGDKQHAGIATFIKRSSGRKFYEWRAEDALESAYRLQAQGLMNVTPELQALLAGLTQGMVVFYFWPHQQCFREHLDHEVKFLHRTQLAVREHVRPRDWNEHSNDELYKLKRAIERG